MNARILLKQIKNDLMVIDINLFKNLSFFIQKVDKLCSKLIYFSSKSIAILFGGKRIAIIQ